MLAGGSNVVVADAGVPGTVVRVLTRGVARDGERLEVAGGRGLGRARRALRRAEGLQGFECLSGIPGSAGATPIQNVGAYGQEVSETVESVRVLDRASGADRRADRGASAASATARSIFKYHDRHVVLAVTFRLRESADSGPLRYAELARALDVPVGGSAPLAEVREAVLALRRGKGMVIDPADPDSVSAGSFFTNPILEPDGFAGCRRAPATPAARPRSRAGRPVKTSAAWLIERAGFPRGYGDGPRRDLHQAHARARQPRRRDHRRADGAGARDRGRRARARFGVALAPEPVLVGHDW